MAAVPFDWFEEVETRDLKRWTLAAAIVVGVHLAGIGGYLYQHQPDEIGDDTAAVTVDLAPGDDVVDQSEVAPQPEVQEKPIEQPPPPEETQTVVEPPPEEKPVEEPKPPPPPPTPARSKGGAVTIAPSWETSLIKHLQRYKRYPAGAQEHSEEGTVLLSFSVDRNGHVLAHRIAQSSGHPELDAEVTSMIERAQPLPPFPTTMSQAKLELTIPIHFSLR